MVSSQVAYSGMLVLDNCVLVQGRSGFVATDVVCMSVKSDTVAIESNTAASSLCDSDSNSGDKSEN